MNPTDHQTTADALLSLNHWAGCTIEQYLEAGRAPTMDAVRDLVDDLHPAQSVDDLNDNTAIAGIIAKRFDIKP